MCSKEFGSSNFTSAVPFFLKYFMLDGKIIKMNQSERKWKIAIYCNF